MQSLENTILWGKVKIFLDTICISEIHFRIPRNSFTCHLIRIASIVLCLDLQSLPTHVSEADQSCGVFWSLACISLGELLQLNNKKEKQVP